MAEMPCRQMEQLSNELAAAVKLRDSLAAWSLDGRAPIRANAEVIRLEGCIAAHLLNCKECRAAA